MALTDALTLALAIAGGIGFGMWIGSTILTSQLRTLAFEVLSNPRVGQIASGISKIGGHFGGGGGGGIGGLIRDGLGFLAANSRQPGTPPSGETKPGAIVSTVRDPRFQ